MFDTLNQTLFALINAPETTSPTVIRFATLAAEGLLYLVALWMVLAWIRGGDALRRAFFNAGLAALLGLVANQTIRLFWANPRPFAQGIGHQFLDHAPDASFPSDHGTILFSIAFALLFSRAYKAGIAGLLIALATAWARVFLGVHWPLDMLGSVAVGIVAAMLVVWVFRGLVGGLFRLALSLYRRLLALLHLPVCLFPR